MHALEGPTLRPDSRPSWPARPRQARFIGGARLALLTALALGAGALQACASEVVVPDSYATIASALASGADTVSVRPGAYPESLVIARSVVLRGLCAAGMWGVDCPLASRPGVMAITVVSGGNGFTLLNLHTSGALAITTNTGLVRGCQCDAGINWQGNGGGAVKQCQVRGNLSMRFGGTGSHCDSNVVALGTITAGSQGSMSIIGNTVLGPSPVGIAGGDDASLVGNVVRGCTNGISSTSQLVSNNLVEDCSGTGYSFLGGSFAAYVRGNVARRIGGRGFDVESPMALFDANVADTTGLQGIAFIGSHTSGVVATNNNVRHSGSTGIDGSQQWCQRLTGNVVLDAGGDGVSVGWSDTLVFNVVGRAYARGIVSLEAPSRGYRVQHNTVYQCGGAAIDLLGGSNAEVDSITNNIGYFNALGLHWATDPAMPARLTASVPDLACNDWIGNASGADSGTPPSALDIAVDPSFCGLASDDVTLTSDSPLAALAGCGQVGARGVGCAGGPTPVLAALASCRVANGRVELAWQLAGAAGTTVTIERTSDRTAWLALATRASDAGGRLAYEDADVAPGATYGYRLTWLQAGRAVTAATTFVTVPADVRLAVRVLGMTNGVADVEVATPSAGEARVELFDVLGRRADGRVVQAGGPGSTRLSLGRSLPPGLYMVAVRFGGQSAHARALVLR